MFGFVMTDLASYCLFVIFGVSETWQLTEPYFANAYHGEFNKLACRWNLLGLPFHMIVKTTIPS